MSKLEQELNTAKALHENGELLKAHQAYQHLLKKQPSNANLLHCLGMVCFQLKDYPLSIDYLQRAIKIIPDNALLYCHLGNVYKTQKNTDQAMRAYQHGLAIDKENPLLINNLGNCYYTKGQLEKAEHYFRRAIQLKPDYVDAHYNLALSEIKQKKTSAKQSLLSVIALHPKHFAAHFQLGTLAMEQQNFEQAAQHFENAQNIQAEHLELQINLGHCYLDLNEYQKAREHYRAAEKLDPLDANIRYNLAILADKQGYHDHAINHYLDVLELSPQHFETHNNLGVLYLYKEHYANALKHFKIALSLHPQDKAIQYKIDSLEQNKNLDTAPPEYIKQLFDQYAQSYDQHLTKALDYQVPELLLQMYLQIQTPCEKALLDLGCGTGLCGELFKSHCQYLSGVDLSGNMLQLAKDKKLYHKLFEQEIIDFLQHDSKKYHIILAGDVLVYSGKLEVLFNLVKQRLQPRGVFIFNVESGTSSPFVMDQSGRFKHHPSYIQALSEKNQLNIISAQQHTTRLQNNNPVQGDFYCLESAN